MCSWTLYEVPPTKPHVGSVTLTAPPGPVALIASAVAACSAESSKATSVALAASAAATGCNVQVYTAVRPSGTTDPVPSSSSGAHVGHVLGMAMAAIGGASDSTRTKLDTLTYVFHGVTAEYST